MALKKPGGSNDQAQDSRGAIIPGPVDEVARHVLERATRQLDGQVDRPTDS